MLEPDLDPWVNKANVIGTSCEIRRRQAAGLCPCCGELLVNDKQHDITTIAEGVRICGFCVYGSCHQSRRRVEWLLHSLAGEDIAWSEFTVNDT